MKCPVCANADLLMSERLGIEIDYCPQCRGVWLDRGELDKIIERSQREIVAQPAPVVQLSRPDPHHFGNRYGHHGSEHSHHGKKSIWKELFD